MATRSSGRWTAANTVTGAFTFYMTGRNGKTPGNNYESIIRIGPVLSEYRAIIDEDTLGNVWAAFDGSESISLQTSQNTWSTLVVNDSGGGVCKIRSNATQATVATAAPSAETLQIGSGDIHLEFAEGALYNVSHLTGTMSAIQSILNSWIAPALAALMVVTADEAIAGENPATSKNIYTTQTPAGPVYVRNTGCYGSGFVSALTALSPWNSGGTGQFNLVAISPTHAIGVTHDGTPLALDTVHFVQADNTVVTRTILTRTVITDTATQFPDISVFLLSSPLPAGIEFARVLPVNFTNYLQIFAAAQIPCFGVDEDQKLLIMDIVKLPSVTTASERMEWGAATGIREDFSENPVAWTSGCPLFTIIDGKLVLLSMATSTLSGTHLAPWHTAINAAMVGETLTDIDLTTYGTY